MTRVGCHHPTFASYARVWPLFHAPSCDRLIAEEQLTVMRQLDASIDRIEKAVLKVVKLLPCYKRLQTIPGIGMILGLTITLETGEVKRLPLPEILPAIAGV